MIIPTGYAQANFRFTGDALPTGAEITMGYDVTGFIGGPDDAAEGLALNWTSSEMFNFQCDSVALTSVLVKFGPIATGPSAIYPTTVTGFESGQSVAPNTSVLVRKTTALGGRAGRGRLFLPGIPEAKITESGAVDASWATSRQNDLNQWLLDDIADDLVPVVLHSAGSPITAPTPITVLLLDSIAATQRRRLRR